MALAAIIIAGLTLAWGVGWAIYLLRRKTKPKITTKAAHAHPVYDLGGQPHIGDAAFSITATNTGPVTVTIDRVKFFVRGVTKQTSLVPVDWVAQTPTSLPVVLKPGDHWMGVVDAGSIKSSIDRKLGQRHRWHVRTVLSDTADRSYDAVVYRVGWQRYFPRTRRWLEV
jgi:hypothetical protein